MDAVTGQEPLDPDEALREAQDSLSQAEKMALLVNDPISGPLHALRTFLTAFGSTANLHRMTTRRDYHAVREVQASLDKSMNLAVSAARANVEKAHAEMAHGLLQSISARASAELASMSRRILWRNIVLIAFLAVAGIAIGAGAGYWRGYQVGHYDAATTIRSARPVANAILAAGGVAALHDWNRLMIDNPIVSVMDKCHGKNLAKQDGRTACKMWLWLTPYVPPIAHAKS